MGIERNIPDVVETIRIVKQLGGRVISIDAGSKHAKVNAVTQLGNRVTLRLSKGKTDPYKLKGWTRQEFNRADAAPPDNRRTARV